MMKVQIQPLLKEMKEDPKYKRLKKTFSEHENFRLPLDSLLDEIKSIHRDRKVRSLNPTDPKFVDKLIIANHDDQGKRSRVTEIMIRSLRAQALLQSAVDSLRFYLLTTFSVELRSFSTKEERTNIVNMALKPFEEFLVDVSVLKESAQLLVNDIDKTAWNLKLSLSALELHVAKERKL